MALESSRFEKIAGQISRSGTSIGHGNFVDPRPKWRISGRAIAATHRQALVVSIFFFSDVVIGGYQSES